MAANEKVFVASPVASAGGRVIASPFQFYTTGEDRLRVVSVNSVADIRINIHSRSVDSAGTVNANADAHVPNTNRTQNTTEHELGVGALLNLTIFASGSGAPQYGQTFVIVQLIRGTGAAAIVLGTLLQGYVTTTQHLAWPGSPIQSSLDGEPPVIYSGIAAPAPGAQFSQTVPAGARWQILTVRGLLTTSAVVANRYPILTMISGVDTITVASQVATIPAATASNVDWWVGSQQTFGPGGVTMQAPLPSPMFLRGGQRVSSFVFAMDPGDAWSVPFFSYREWLEVP